MMKDVDFQPELSAGQLIGGALLPRELADLTIWKKTPFDAGHALADLFMLANTESGQHRLQRGLVVDYRPGWCLWSNKALAARWGWRREAVERFMVELEKSEIIRRHDIAQYGKVLELIDFGHATGSERAANGQPFGHPTGTVGEGEGVIGEGEGVETAANFQTGGKNFPSIALALDYFAKNGSDYTADQVRTAWHDCNSTVRDGLWLDWNGRAPVGDWRSRMASVLARRFISAKPLNGQVEKKNGAGLGGRSPAQARYEISRELETVQSRLDSAHELNLPPVTADVTQERELQKRLRELEAVTA